MLPLGFQAFQRSDSHAGMRCNALHPNANGGCSPLKIQGSGDSSLFGYNMMLGLKYDDPTPSQVQEIIYLGKRSDYT